MKRNFRRMLFATALALLVGTGAAMAQTGLQSRIVTDNLGNTLAQIAGDGLTLETAVDVNLPGTVTEAVLAPPPSAPAGWTLTGWGNGALDIASGPSGVWFTAASGSIYTAGGPIGTQHVAGGVAVRIAVSTYGIPFCVTSGKSIFYLQGGVWVATPGTAIDIAAGGDGSVYILNPDGSLAKWNGSGWTAFAGGGGGSRIAVDEKGNPWVVNQGHEIYRWDGTQWQRLLGAAQDISISLDGAVYVVGMQSGPGGYMVYKWDPSVSNWNQIFVYGTVAAAASGGHVYVGRSARSLLPTIMR